MVPAQTFYIVGCGCIEKMRSGSEENALRDMNYFGGGRGTFDA
jgi:hypothetical protein